MSQKQPGSPALLDQLRQPGIVQMTAEIAGLDPRLPKAWDQQRQRDRDKD
jgi:hypothetical protein